MTGMNSEHLSPILRLLVGKKPTVSNQLAFAQAWETDDFSRRRSERSLRSFAQNILHVQRPSLRESHAKMYLSCFRWTFRAMLGWSRFGAVSLRSKGRCWWIEKWSIDCTWAHHRFLESLSSGLERLYHSVHAVTHIHGYASNWSKPLGKILPGLFEQRWTIRSISRCATRKSLSSSFTNVSTEQK